MSRAITNQHLMFERQGLRGNGADAPGPEEFHERDQQVYRQKRQIAHEWNVHTSAMLRKTAR